MRNLRKLPVGIENFREIRRSGFYYTDKTKLIADLLENWGAVNLFTRPRRFGKSLNMSMLRHFFEIGADVTLFDGLYIASREDLFEEYGGKFPVIFLSLKDVDGSTFSEARARLTDLIGTEAERFSFLLDSDRLSENEKEKYRALTALQEGCYRMQDAVLAASLKVLTRLLCKHFGQEVILLLDEYDVPLEKAFTHGYYAEMAALLRSLFGQAFKSNDYLKFAVLTGCLRVSKESIFTGLNNFKVLSIADARFEEYFGFTDAEVRELLAYYGLQEHFEEMKAWYDGYHFGNVDVYCPWDIINHVDRLCADPEAEPQAYWINSSANALVRRFVDKADRTTKNELEQLIAGAAISKPIRLELTYEEIDQSVDNLWSVLFTTGYLTQVGKAQCGIYSLTIPNQEVREVFLFQIRRWFEEGIARNPEGLCALCRSLLCGDAQKIEGELTKILGQTISILDARAREGQRENFYHGLLLGLFRSQPGWLLRSNAEAGDGFSDILIEPEDPELGIVIEIKYARSFSGLEKACAVAVKQIKEHRYDSYLREDGREKVLAYGIAFHKKRCKVTAEWLEENARPI